MFLILDTVFGATHLRTLKKLQKGNFSVPSRAPDEDLGGGLEVWSLSQAERVAAWGEDLPKKIKAQIGDGPWCLSLGTVTMVLGHGDNGMVVCSGPLGEEGYDDVSLTDAVWLHIRDLLSPWGWSLTEDP